MIFKDKYDRIALRCFTRVLRDILRQQEGGKTGLIFASSYTIYTDVKLYGTSSRLVELLSDISKTDISIVWLLPPPSTFKVAWLEKMHLDSISNLFHCGIYPAFDECVHAKFLLYWGMKKTAATRAHYIYYGSTNFTRRGLERNIEEFYCNRWENEYRSDVANDQWYHFEKALKVVDYATELYKDEKKLRDYGIDIQKLIQRGTKDVERTMQKAIDTVDKLTSAVFAHQVLHEILANVWNAPGRRFASQVTDRSLKAIGPYAALNLEPLEEILASNKKMVSEFLARWDIDTSDLSEIPRVVVRVLSMIREEMDTYLRAGYREFLLKDESTFIEQLPRTHAAASRLREIW